MKKLTFDEMADQMAVIENESCSRIKAGGNPISMYSNFTCANDAISYSKPILNNLFTSNNGTYNSGGTHDIAGVLDRVQTIVDGADIVAQFTKSPAKELTGPIANITDAAMTVKAIDDYTSGTITENEFAVKAIEGGVAALGLIDGTTEAAVAAYAITQAAEYLGNAAEPYIEQIASYCDWAVNTAGGQIHY